MMTKNEMGKIVSSWGEDPLRRMILGLNIALDGAIAEAEEENPFDYREDITALLESVWNSVKAREMSNQLIHKYENELTPVSALGAKMVFTTGQNDELDCLTIRKEDFEREFTLDPEASPDELRTTIKTAAETWAREYAESKKI